MKRRDFLKGLAATTSSLIVRGQNALASGDRLGPILSERILGRTGEKVTMLGVGGFHIGWTSERDAQETIETARHKPPVLFRMDSGLYRAFAFSPLNS